MDRRSRVWRRLTVRHVTHAPITYARPLTVGETITLDAEGVAGLVFRKVNPKEAFTLRDADHRYFRASLLSLTAAHATALVYEAMPEAPESPIEVVLACAVLQRQRMLWVAQKAAELGVAHLQPLLTLKSVQPDGLVHEKIHAWPGQSLKGARQCRRGSVPETHPPLTLDAFTQTARWHDADARIFLDDRAEASNGAIFERGDLRSLVLVVGPEGGFAHVERSLLVARAAQPIRLGARVLRAESAVIVGLAVVQHRLGDLRP